MIVASLPIFPVNPPLGVGLFVGGWAFQFAGHALFEKQQPSFFNDPFYLLIGPVWVAIEMAQLLGIEVPLPEAPVPAHEAAEHRASVN
jgi:uncharacterized membrane protein YGL010W